ncbi:hypothetical protein [Acutalibacter intestini]|uniref:hypothetical protein n=1 Tax=Acutalibacter intestini TaxID=3093659 RepID=UPI002AC8E047|nr:hypothetical protein [Acutalibacter sp. M00204]
MVKENYKGERGSGNVGSVQRNALAGLAVSTGEGAALPASAINGPALALGNAGSGQRNVLTRLAVTTGE